jgi:Tol biopolymer transport system component
MCRLLGEARRFHAIRRTPIRRFSDIICHRALLREIGAADDPLPEGLSDLAEHVSGRERLAKLGHQPEGQPEWSADGRWIAFVQREPAPGSDHTKQAVYVMRPNGTERHRVTPPADFYTDIAWAPKGERLVAVQEASGLDCSSLVLTTTSGRAHAIRNGDCGTAPSWSHDGRYLAFAHRPALDPQTGTFRSGLRPQSAPMPY